jgi:dsDNA-binding SOS-regulon protein
VNNILGESKLSKTKQSAKIARDVNGKKIGKIIEDNKPSDKIVIAQRSLLGRTILVTFTQKDVVKREENSFWLNIKKSEFNMFVKRKRAEIKQKVKAAKFAEASGNTKALSASFTWGKI